MDEFDSMIEKYRRELLEFSKNNPVSGEKCSAPCKDENSGEDSSESAAAAEDEKEKPYIEAGAEAFQNEAEPVTRGGLIQTVAETDAQNTGYIAQQFDNYEDFLKNNPQNGLLKVQVFAAGQAFPVANARVTVTLELKNGSRQMFDGLTDINGIADNIRLPAPSAEMSQSPSESPTLPYSSYTTYIEHPEFVDAEFTNVPVFAGIKSIQSVELIPTVNVGSQPQFAQFNEGDSFTRLKGVE